MATLVVPFRSATPKRRLVPLPHEARLELAAAMLADVLSACEAVGETIVAEAPGGQGNAVAEALARVQGPVAIVNADLPCATSADLEELLGAAPALVAAADGTTNALSLPDPALFQALYGPGSAKRFRALGLTPLDLPNLADDVDELADLERIAQRTGPFTRAAFDAIRISR